MTKALRLFALTLLTLTLTGCPMQEANGNNQVPDGPRTPQDIMRDGNHMLNEPSV